VHPERKAEKTDVEDMKEKIRTSIGFLDVNYPPLVDERCPFCGKLIMAHYTGLRTMHFFCDSCGANWDKVDSDDVVEKKSFITDGSGDFEKIAD
jgi:hypothetical protein